MKMFKILLPANEIPLGSTVTKRTGEKPYTLKDRIRIFGETGDARELKATDGTRLLVSETGDANVVGGETELLWYAEEFELLDLLNSDDIDNK